MSRPELSRAQFEAELLYDHALRTVERDRQVLEQLRSRTNVLLTATSIVTALFGQAIVGHAGHWRGVFVVLALVAFGVGLLCCLGVLWPVGDRGAHASERVYSSLDKAPEELAGESDEDESAPDDGVNKPDGWSRGIRDDLARFVGRWREWSENPGTRRWKVTVGEMDVKAAAEQSSESAAKRELGERMYNWHRWNLRTLERRNDLLGLASMLLLAQVIFWALAVR